MPADENTTTPESPSVATAAVLIVMLSFLGFVALSLLGLWTYYGWAVQRPTGVSPRIFPAPRVQVDQQAELQQLLEAQRRRLAEYAWIDKDRGLIRIPIARAMELLAARGRGAYAPLEAPAQAGRKTDADGAAAEPETAPRGLR